MGTTVTISLVTPTEDLATQIATAAFAQVVNFESRFSRFLPTSELSLLNQTQDLVVSDEFFAILAKSYELYVLTEGAFNPLVQIARYGYTKDYQALPVTEAISVTDVDSINVDFGAVERDVITKRVRLQPNQQLDFGGVLKGYLAHLLANQIESHYSECTGVIVNLGGDLHTRGHDEHGAPFVFFVFNPVTDEEIPVPLTNTSLATSGVYARTWQTTGGAMHHILTGAGRPDTDLLGVSASIVHPDGATAEALTKLLLHRGPRTVLTAVGDDLCRYILITDDGSVKTNIS